MLFPLSRSNGTNCPNARSHTIFLAAIMHRLRARILPPLPPAGPVLRCRHPFGLSTRAIPAMRDTKLSVIFLGILDFLAVGFVLKTLAPILLPFVVAVFLSRVFSPLNKALRRRRVP